MKALYRKLVFHLGLRKPGAAFRFGLIARRDARPTPSPVRPNAGVFKRRRNVFGLAGAATGYLLRLPASLRYFARGYRYGERLPAPAAVTPVGTAAQTAGPLEECFDAHSGLLIYKRRHYLRIYERHFERFRGQPLRLLEIGVLGGGSLEMWREYLGPRAHIYGVDVDPRCAEHAREGIDIIIGDQSDPAFWAGVLEDLSPLDIVLDDGGHQPDQQAVTLECVLPHIRPGGVYLCEDIGGPFHPFHSFIDGLTRPLSAVALPRTPTPPSALQQHIASVHRYPMITVIERPPAPVEDFEAVGRGGSRQPR